MNTLPRFAAAFLLALMMAMSSFAAFSQTITPLRLSYVEGEVSFWRFGADDWAEARHNIPLAAVLPPEFSVPRLAFTFLSGGRIAVVEVEGKDAWGNAIPQQ